MEKDSSEIVCLFLSSLWSCLEMAYYHIWWWRCGDWFCWAEIWPVDGTRARHYILCCGEWSSCWFLLLICNGWCLQYANGLRMFDIFFYCSSDVRSCTVRRSRTALLHYIIFPSKSWFITRYIWCQRNNRFCHHGSIFLNLLWKWKKEVKWLNFWNKLAL